MKFQAGDVMKISTITIHIILCLIVLMLMTGCSHSHNQILALWQERQMDDDRRIYGNPYESSNRQHYFLFNATSCNLLIFGPNLAPQPVTGKKSHPTSTLTLLSADY